MNKTIHFNTIKHQAEEERNLDDQTLIPRIRRLECSIESIRGLTGLLLSIAGSPDSVAEYLHQIREQASCIASQNVRKTKQAHLASKFPVLKSTDIELCLCLAMNLQDTLDQVSEEFAQQRLCEFRRKGSRVIDPTEWVAPPYKRQYSSPSGSDQTPDHPSTESWTGNAPSEQDDMVDEQTSTSSTFC